MRVNEHNELEMEVDEDMLSKHAHNVMCCLGATIENMDDSEFLNTMLTSIGQKHHMNGICPTNLDVSILTSKEILSWANQKSRDVFSPVMASEIQKKP